MKFVFVSHGISKVGLRKITDLTNKDTKDVRILFIDTPAKTYPPNPKWLTKSLDELRKFGFKLTVFDIETAYKEKVDVEGIVQESDIICISGGNTFYFLYWANKIGLKEILQKFLSRGGIYMGESAGVVCQIADLTPIKWLDEPDKAPEVVDSGMQLTSYVVIPHWGNAKYQKDLKRVRDYYLRQRKKVTTLKDGQIMIVDGNEVEIVG